MTDAVVPERQETDFKAHVLVVDDNAANRSLLVAVLDREDVRVSSVKDGRQALNFVSENKPDLILLDVMMDGMNGFDVLRTLKQNDATSDILIIMVTAVEDREFRHRLRDAGAWDVLTKPLKIKVLLASVRHAIKLSALAS